MNIIIKLAFILLLLGCNEGENSNKLHDSNMKRLINYEELFMDFKYISVIKINSNIDTLYYVKIKVKDQNEIFREFFPKDLYLLNAKLKPLIINELLSLKKNQLPSSKKICSYYPIDTSGYSTGSTLIDQEVINQYTPISIAVESLFLINIITKKDFWKSSPVPILISCHPNKINMNPEYTQEIYDLYQNILVGYNGVKEPVLPDTWWR